LLNKEEVMGRIHETGVIAILRVGSSESCLKAMDALREGGLDVLEITSTTPNAPQIIAQARKKYEGNMLIGMGTVLDGDTAKNGIQAGAQFIVSPSLHKDVLDVCVKQGVVGCPGAFTATEMVQASRWGADLVKVFPASEVGPTYIRAILAPLPWLKLVPTGGVGLDNAAEFIKAGSYCLGAGGALVSNEAIKEGRFDSLTENARKIIRIVKEARK
jgi:2-dehydro-3-deoxyphosphogluconate aldolase/(4S)-4-hydroxy-2-oxoglutarate aldolase